MKEVSFLCGLLLMVCSCNGVDKNKPSDINDNPKEIVHSPKTTNFQGADFTYPGSDISFKVNVEGNNLIIKPESLSVSNEAFRHDITGYTVINAEIGDLNLDSYPEIFVYLISQGSGSYGKLIGYSVNNGKSASLVYLPEISENKAINKGYMGHDEMAIVESTFCRRFPIYQEGDSNSKPTGKTRQIQYKLVNGENGRVLEIDKVLEF